MASPTSRANNATQVQQGKARGLVKEYDSKTSWKLGLVVVTVIAAFAAIALGVHELNAKHVNPVMIAGSVISGVAAGFSLGAFFWYWYQQSKAERDIMKFENDLGKEILGIDQTNEQTFYNPGRCSPTLRKIAEMKQAQLTYDQRDQYAAYEIVAKKIKNESWAGLNY